MGGGGALVLALLVALLRLPPAAPSQLGVADQGGTADVVTDAYSEQKNPNGSAKISKLKFPNWIKFKRKLLMVKL